jgi:transketolase
VEGVNDKLIFDVNINNLGINKGAYFAAPKATRTKKASITFITSGSELQATIHLNNLLLEKNDKLNSQVISI